MTTLGFQCQALCQIIFITGDVIMGTMASQITSLTIVYSTVYWGADQRKHQSSASLAFVQGIHRWLVNSPHTWPVTWKMFPFDNVIIFSPISEFLHPDIVYQAEFLTTSPCDWKKNHFFFLFTSKDPKQNIISTSLNGNSHVLGKEDIRNKK